MKLLRRLSVLLLLPVAALAADKVLKIDKDRSFVDVDVDATKNFTAHLDRYDLKMSTDEAGKVKTAVLTFQFADLKTGKEKRDEDMIKWLGGGNPDGRFELGNLAVTPNGEGQASGRLTFHGVTERIEFPVQYARNGDTYTVTGEATIDHRTWGLKVIRMALLFTVNPEVKVRFKFTGTATNEPVKP